MADSVAVAFDTTCLFSTVKNISGGRRKYGFLPPHGRELDVDEEFTMFGNVLESIQRFERVTDRRVIQAFERAIDQGKIEIVSTPNPILQDVTTNAVKMLQLDNASLVVVDPCWTISL